MWERRFVVPATRKNSRLSPSRITPFARLAASPRGRQPEVNFGTPRALEGGLYTGRILPPAARDAGGDSALGRRRPTGRNGKSAGAYHVTLPAPVCKMFAICKPEGIE